MLVGKILSYPNLSHQFIVATLTGPRDDVHTTWGSAIWTVAPQSHLYVLVVSDVWYFILYSELGKWFDKNRLIKLALMWSSPLNYKKPTLSSIPIPANLVCDVVASNLRAPANKRLIRANTRERGSCHHHGIPRSALDVGLSTIQVNFMEALEWSSCDLGHWLEQ